MFSQLSIDEILCGNRENPLGVNVLKPELLLVLTLLLQLKITYIDGIFKLLRTEHMNVPMGIDTNEPITSMSTLIQQPLAGKEEATI